MTLADRIVVMNKGGVEQVGTPNEIYNRPGTTYVAGFIGTPGLNLLSGVVDSAAAWSRSATASDWPMTASAGPRSATVR